MNKTLGFQLVVYGLLVAGLSYLTYHLAPALARPTLIAGLAGGALCLAWGLRAIAGSPGKALPLLTLIPTTFVMLSQTVITWLGRGEEAPGRRQVAAVITVLLVLSIGMLMRIAYAGVVFDGQPVSPAKHTGNKSAAQANAGKRA
jgi:hypothetical protein